MATGKRSALNAASLHLELEQHGYARLPHLFSHAECRKAAALWSKERRFRKRVNMDKKQFGKGEYRYFDDPLPDIVKALRKSFYELLVPVANHWARDLGDERSYPERYADFRDECEAAGQVHPTPLMLRYRDGGYNRLHQDLYGGVTFPLQLVILLSEPGKDFEGGEFVMVEQVSRLQPRPFVVPLARGDGLIFPTFERPVPGSRGPRRASMEHGISTVHRGDRLALGIIFHDAE